MNYSNIKLRKKEIGFVLFIVLFSLMSCTKNFDDINTDPNGVTEVATPYLITSAQQRLITINSSLSYNKTMMLWAQLWAQRETTNRSRYDLNADGDWSNFYSYGLPDLNSIIELNSGEDKEKYAVYGDNNNQIAVAMIMKTWAFSLMTDTWGNIPYSEAFDPKINFPKYDAQSEIYPDLIQKLKDAVALIDETKSGFISGDLMYNGDMTKWKKFANSLRARIALRLSNVNPTLANSELNSALSADVFTSNDDNALINFQTEDTYANPVYLESIVQNWTFPTELLVNRMKSLNDPRLPVIADLNAYGGYVGLPYGLGDDQSTGGMWEKEDTISRLGARTREPDFPSILMTYSELLFIRAEAAQRSWVGGDAAGLYNQAITANLEFWGIDAGSISTYLSEPEVVYNPTNWTAQLGEQKWLSFYMQGAQAYFEWRRLQAPALTIPTYAPLSYKVTEMPRRFFYPTAEKSLNGIQLKKAIEDMGGNTLMTRTWIDPL